jgi:putative solute:sodium symporter small subunit
LEKEEYRTSFFSPTTHQARMNRNLIVQLFIIWAVAIFGFQILLKILSKPVPEEALVTFIPAWERIEAGNAMINDYQVAGRSMVQVTGKLTLKPHDYDALKDAISWTLSNLLDDNELVSLQKEIQLLNRIKDEMTSFRDERYQEVKGSVISKAAPALGIDEGILLAQLLPLALDDDMENMADENRLEIPGIMSLYLTHNRSVLTDTIFLGFPFHYFYTAVLLLIFFVGLCWLYCYRTDKLHARLNFLEQTTD